MEYYIQALAIFEESSNLKGISSCMDNLGIVYINLGLYEEAKECYEKALEYFNKAKKINMKIGNKNAWAENLGQHN